MDDKRISDLADSITEYWETQCISEDQIKKMAAKFWSEIYYTNYFNARPETQRKFINAMKETLREAKLI